jgi:hypothetical protein
MKYLLRAVKYFIMITVLVVVILAVLALLKIIPADPETMFRGGWKSVGEILIIFAAFSAVYPKMGYTKRDAEIAGEYSEIQQGIIEYMADHGYILEKEDGENMSFRSRSTYTRIMKMGEDRVTMTRKLGGYTLEGISKEVNRLASGLEYKFRITE